MKLYVRKITPTVALTLARKIDHERVMEALALEHAAIYAVQVRGAMKSLQEACEQGNEWRMDMMGERVKELQRNEMDALVQAAGHAARVRAYADCAIQGKEWYQANPEPIRRAPSVR